MFLIITENVEESIPAATNIKCQKLFASSFDVLTPPVRLLLNFLHILRMLVK